MTGLIAHLMDVSVRSLALAVVALAVLWMPRRLLGTAVRHAIWAAAVGGMLALFAVGPALPGLSVRVLRATPVGSSPTQSAPARSVLLPAMPEALPARITASDARRILDWREIGGLVYATVALAMLARLLSGAFLVRRLLANSNIIEDARVSGMVPHESDSIAIPLTVGWLRPKILLPTDWREWDSAKLESVLTHECAHIRRRDSLVALAARINRCLFWFHPLAWLAERRLALLAEQACDEACLLVLKHRETYARLLLEMAGSVHANDGRIYRHALPMATSSHIRERIEAILDEGRAISGGLTRTGWVALLLGTVPVIYCAAAVRLEHRPGLKAHAMMFAQPPLIESQDPAPQAPAPLQSQPATKADPAVVLIRAAVRDPLNRFVTGLSKDNFKLLEDGVEQEISQFSSEDAPLSVGIVFDSGSASDGTLQQSREALAQFFKTANPEDEFFLVQFGDRSELIGGFTTNAEEIQDKLASSASNGSRALADAVYMASQEMKKAKNPRRVLLVISGSADDGSRHADAEKIRSAVTRMDPQIYVVGISATAASGVADLFAFPIDNLVEFASITELPEITARLSVELRNQYVLGYTPKKTTRDRQLRSVNVEIPQINGLPPLRVTPSGGYFFRLLNSRP